MPVSLESSLNVMRQREVTVVAAEDQVIADRHAMELHGAVLTLLHADQCEVARPAADIAHQNLLTGRHEVTPVRRVLVDPRIERRLRLFDEDDLRQPRLLRGLHGQFASHFIERRGEREDKVLLREGMFGELRVPRCSRMLQIPRADGDGRESLDILSPLPRQEVGRPIDPRMTQPRLRRRDHAAGNERAVIAREVADEVAVTLRVTCARLRGALRSRIHSSCPRRFVTRSVTATLPRHPRRVIQELAARRLIVKRRQRVARLDLSRRDDLRDRKRADATRRLMRIDISHRRVRRPEIESHNEAAG